MDFNFLLPILATSVHFSAHPHEPDINGLNRVCNVHNIPLATNLATAEMIMVAFREGYSPANLHKE